MGSTSTIQRLNTTQHHMTEMNPIQTAKNSEFKHNMSNNSSMRPRKIDLSLINNVETENNWKHKYSQQATVLHNNVPLFLPLDTQGSQGADQACLNRIRPLRELQLLPPYNKRSELAEKQAQEE